MAPSFYNSVCGTRYAVARFELSSPFDPSPIGLTQQHILPFFHWAEEDLGQGGHMKGKSVVLISWEPDECCDERRNVCVCVTVTLFLTFSWLVERD